MPLKSLHKGSFLPRECPHGLFLLMFPWSLSLSMPRSTSPWSLNCRTVGKTMLAKIQSSLGPQHFSFYWKASLFVSKMESVSNILWNYIFLLYNVFSDCNNALGNCWPNRFLSLILAPLYLWCMFLKSQTLISCLIRYHFKTTRRTSTTYSLAKSQNLWHHPRQKPNNLKSDFYTFLALAYSLEKTKSGCFRECHHLTVLGGAL